VRVVATDPRTRGGAIAIAGGGRNMRRSSSHDREVTTPVERVARVWRGIDMRPGRSLALILLLALSLSVARILVHPVSLSSGETGNWWPIIDNVEDGRRYNACLTDYFPFCGPTNQVTAAREPLPVLLFAA